MDIAFLPMTPGYQQMIKNGQLKHLAVLTPDRVQAFPAVPAITEIEGFKDFTFSQWGGIFVSVDTPESEAAKLGAAIYDVVTSPAYAQWIIEQGLTPAVRASLEENDTVWSQETKRVLDLAKRDALTQ